MLSSDSLSVCNFVPLAASWTYGISFAIVLGDHIRANLTFTANDLETVGHSALPMSLGDSASR